MAHDPSEMTAPSDADILGMVRVARDRLPDAFRARAETVLVRVADFAPDDMLDALGIEDAFDLTGLYDGVPLTEASVSDPAPQSDTIWLFRRPILDEWASRGDVTLGDLVAHVFVHELAHHFGWSDDQIARIDRWWE